ncbi:mpv17-like protein 2 [Adelges cooleyi]|uniref:mpv17-like protein 2 n=1 Tax=Adelges cooleyi TaxID=133065 RepID=UPI00217FA351|nr:mpv17-like protein 2 [Adelges cooleyi]XP_050429276.1 mpv17-like protein 2 [Adelges cooleyi]XP_050429277.1 mpv17-like protein 2 [Adelges cooleyi]
MKILQNILALFLLMKTHLVSSPTVILLTDCKPEACMSPGKQCYSLVTRAATYLFDRHLYFINTASGTLLMCTGDAVQQNIERYRGLSDKYDWTRTARIAIVGTILGTAQHFFYHRLDKKYPGQEMKTIAKKIFFDQTLCTPINILIFIYGLGFLDNRTWTKMNEEFKDKFITIFMVDCGIFIPTQCVNFKFVGPKYRLLFTNVISIMYDTFLSYIKYTHDIIKLVEKQNNRNIITN